MCPKPVPPTTATRVVSQRKSAPARPKRPTQGRPDRPSAAPVRGRRPSLPARALPRSNSSRADETTGRVATPAARRPQRNSSRLPGARRPTLPTEDTYTEPSWDGDESSDSAGIAELDEERRKRGLSSALWNAVSIAALVALCVGLVWLVGFSQVLAVKNIRVTGADRLGQQFVRQQLADADGTPLARLDLNKYSDVVLALPGVESVDVSRSWPTTMTVVVTESELVGQVKEGDKAKSLAPDGSVFVLPGVEPSGPVVTLDVEPSNVDAVRAAVAKTLSTLPAEMTARIVSATAKSPDSVEFTLTSGATVLWGDSSEPYLKTRVLELLLREQSARYDVSAPTVPVRSGSDGPGAGPSADPTTPPRVKNSGAAKPASGASKKPAPTAGRTAKP